MSAGPPTSLLRIAASHLAVSDYSCQNGIIPSRTPHAPNFRHTPCIDAIRTSASSKAGIILLCAQFISHSQGFGSCTQSRAASRIAFLFVRGRFGIPRRILGCSQPLSASGGRSTGDRSPSLRGVTLSAVRHCTLPRPRLSRGLQKLSRDDTRTATSLNPLSHWLQSVPGDSSRNCLLFDLRFLYLTRNRCVQPRNSVYSRSDTAKKQFAPA